MPKHAVLLIVNPSADLGRAWRWAADLRPIVDAYGGADWTGTVYPTHASHLARQAAMEGYELVVAVGGDGTVHEVINGLMLVPADRRPRLGVVPTGSGNDFAHNIGLKPTPAEAIRQVLTGRPRKIDVGMLKDERGRCEYWNNSVGIGFDAAVVIRSRNIPLVRGFLVYLLAVCQTIFFHHVAYRLQVTADDETWDTMMMLLVLCNGRREGGGFAVAPKACPDDGVFNYVGMYRLSRLMMFRLLPEVIRGTHERFRQVRSGEFHKLALRSDRPLVIHADGEIFAGFGMDVRQVTLEILPSAIEVIV